MTISEKRKVGAYLRAKYDTTSQIHIAQDGAVSIHVAQMQNTNQAGWIFAGWDTELLADSRR